MKNKKQKENLSLIKRLIKNGYTDLGWAHERAELAINFESISPLQELNCSIYSEDKDHIVFIDNDREEILHIDLSE